MAAIIFVVVLVPRWTFRPRNRPDLRDYTAQELRGREIYKKEGCTAIPWSAGPDWDHGPQVPEHRLLYDIYHLLGSPSGPVPTWPTSAASSLTSTHMLHHKNPRYVKPPALGIMPLPCDYLPHPSAPARIPGHQRKRPPEETPLGPHTCLCRPPPSARPPAVLPTVPVASHPPKYTLAEIEELMYGSSHEAANAKGAPLQGLATLVFPNKEALRRPAPWIPTSGS